jgi:hypothetical protein
VTATNLAEVPNLTHNLDAGALVMVYELYGLDESPYYVFDSGGSGGSGDVIAADVMADTNQALTGLTTIDDITLENGDYVFLQNQTDPTENGLYIFQDGDLSGNVHPFGILVLIGTANKHTLWAYQTDQTDYTYEQVGGGGGGSQIVKVKYAATANITALSGLTAQPDGVTVQANDLVLAKSQSTPGDRKIYKVASGTWTAHSIPQPDYVGVIAGTANAGLTFQLTAANTYTAMGAVYK